MAESSRWAYFPQNEWYCRRQNVGQLLQRVCHVTPNGEQRSAVALIVQTRMDEAVCTAECRALPETVFP